MKATDPELVGDPTKDDGFTADAVRDSRESPLTQSDDDLTMVDSGSTDKQEGVKRIEAVAMSWSTKSLAIAYVG